MNEQEYYERELRKFHKAATKGSKPKEKSFKLRRKLERKRKQFRQNGF